MQKYEMRFIIRFIIKSTSVPSSQLMLKKEAPLLQLWLYALLTSMTRGYHDTKDSVREWEHILFHCKWQLKEGSHLETH